MCVDFVAKAESATDHGIRYQLGHGGWRPQDALPGKPGAVVLHDKHSGCDCSGFLAWVLGWARDKTIVRGMWGVSTDSIYRDATTAQKFFRRLAAPVPGCFAVYPDKGKAQGHCALVVDVQSRTIIDCSGSKNGIAKRLDDKAHFFTRPDAIFVERIQQAA